MTDDLREYAGRPNGALRAVVARITEVTFTPEDDQHWHRAITVQWRGAEDHCVKQGLMVWDDTAGQWEWEPSPSSRDDDFIARTRYPYDKATALAARLLAEQINPTRAGGDVGWKPPEQQASPQVAGGLAQPWNETPASGDLGGAVSADEGRVPTRREEDQESQPKRRGPRPGPRPIISGEAQAIWAAWCAEWDALTDEERWARNTALDLAIREAERG